jgi:hypothetical protein
MKLTENGGDESSPKKLKPFTITTMLVRKI